MQGTFDLSLRLHYALVTATHALAELIGARELVAQVRDEVVGIERFASDALYQLLRHVGRTIAIHILLQPAQHKARLTVPQTFVEVREHPVQSLEDLRGIQIPQRIAWKVAKASAPMPILQDTMAVALRLDTQVVAIFRAQQGVLPLPIGKRTAEGVLPQTRLRLVHAH